MANLIVLQMLNSVVCIIILKMPSDLHRLVCHTARKMLQGIENWHWFIFSVVCCLTDLTPRPIYYKTEFVDVWTLAFASHKERQVLIHLFCNIVMISLAPSLRYTW